MEKGLKTLCDKVDAITVASREADARHCASISLLHESWLAWDCRMSKKNKPTNYHS
jgi:hypothetical protein